MPNNIIIAEKEFGIFSVYLNAIVIFTQLFYQVLYSFLNFISPVQFIYIIAFIPLLINMKTVYLNKESRLLDSELKKVALSTFLFAILFGFLN